MGDIVIPAFKDPSTNNGDWRHDAEFRMGWNACRDIVVESMASLRDENEVLQKEVARLGVEVTALKPYRDNHHDLVRHMAHHDAEVIKRFLATEAPRIDAANPDLIDPDLHHCEWVLYQERERLHSVANQTRQQTVFEKG